jgi:DNA excision repair protein ERCC-4
MGIESRIIKPIKIIADDREANSKTVQELRKLAGVEVHIQRLPLGDYEIDRAILFERKSLIDLVVSIKDGRLFRQGIKLASSPIRCAIVLEGTAQDLKDSKMRREAIQGALVSLTIVLGIPLLRSKNPQETARLMIYAARQIRTMASGAIARRAKRPRGKRKLQLHFLQGLPGVGPERARNMLDTFGSVEKVITTDRNELMRVPGIGPFLAKKIRWIVAANE